MSALKLALVKKFLPHIIVLLILGGIAAFYFLWNEDESTINKRESNFKIEKPESVTKIILHNERKQTITLEKKNGLWLVNGKFDAREDLIANLLTILSRIESDAPVSKAAHDNVLREMLARNIQVQVFKNNSSSPEKVFYVGGSTTDGKGTYMLLDVNGKIASRPHVVRVPGLVGHLTPSFEMDEETWHSRKIFDIKPEKIAELTVRYPQAISESFSIVAKGDSFELHNANGEIKATKQSILYSYCAMYQGIYFEAYDNENIERQLILKNTPFAEFSLKEKSGKQTDVKLFYMPVNKRSKRLVDEQGNEVTSDVDRFYALANGKDFAIAQVYVFGKLLRKYQDFFPPQK